MAANDYSYMIEELLGTGILSGLAGSIPASLLSIASYVLTALALYTVAERRGLNRPWLAWIPVANAWILGSLSDQYSYVVKGKIKSKRKVLIGLNILSVVLSVAMVIVAVVMTVQIVLADDYVVEWVMGVILLMLALLLPMAGAAIAYAIVRYMALYDIYKSMDPNNSVLYLVLSILVGVTEPFFLFFNRDKDLGMPPRRQEYTYAPEQPPQEPWENRDYL